MESGPRKKRIQREIAQRQRHGRGGVRWGVEEKSKVGREDSGTRWRAEERKTKERRLSVKKKPHLRSQGDWLMLAGSRAGSI